MINTDDSDLIKNRYERIAPVYNLIEYFMEKFWIFN